MAVRVMISETNKPQIYLYTKQQLGNTLQLVMVNSS